MSIYSNPLVLGGKSNPVLITKTITLNGSYYSSNDNADGYNQVIVNVSGGGSSSIETWDFTSGTPAVGTARGWSLTANDVTYNNSGAVFTATTSYITVGNITMRPLTIEIVVSAMSLSSGTHRRFVMGNTTNGFIYRSTGVWAFYNGSWQDSTETNGSFFDDSIVKIIIDSSNKWHIYKDGTRWWEPSGAQNLSTLMIGSSGGQSINSATIESLTLN